jgi:lysophospholipase L1-like esterase
MARAAGGAALVLFAAGAGFGAEKIRLIASLDEGKDQTVVLYGTDLTQKGAWVEQLKAEFQQRYPNQVNLINSGMTGLWSEWGVKNLDRQVITNRPDAVFIEFAINDSFLMSRTPVPQARVNFVKMIERIRAANKNCDIILMVMNPPLGKHLTDRPNINAYNQMYRDLAVERRLILIDHDRNWQKILKEDPKRYSAYVPDGLHPNAEGCKAVITPEILRVLGIGLEPPKPKPDEKPPAPAS